MKIELKNIKHAAFASQETNCFAATVYIDGKKEGTVSNEGTGGPNNYHPYGLYQKLTEYADSLPEIEAWKNEDGSPHMMKTDPDILIGDILGEWLGIKELKRLTKGRIAFVRGADIYTTGKMDDARMATILCDIAGAKQKLNADHILNVMSERDALLAIVDRNAFLARFSPKADDVAALAAPGV